MHRPPVRRFSVHAARATTSFELANSTILMLQSMWNCVGSSSFSGIDSRLKSNARARSRCSNMRRYARNRLRARFRASPSDISAGYECKPNHAGILVPFICSSSSVLSRLPELIACVVRPSISSHAPGRPSAPSAELLHCALHPLAVSFIPRLHCGRHSDRVVCARALVHHPL